MPINSKEREGYFMSFHQGAPTPHNEAHPGDFAKTVLMPGDPLRAKYVAETYLEHAKCVNQVRGMLAYTGEYKGCPISIMGSGMGIPSMGIYSYELFAFYDVDNIIRIGTAGAASDEIQLMDVILADRAYSTSDYALIQSGFTGNCLPASSELNAIITKTAKTTDLHLVTGAVSSGGVFYRENIHRDPEAFMGEVKALEMESFALFANAKALGKKATCLVTITDNQRTGELLTPEQRKTHLGNMFTLALESGIKM